MFIIRWFLENLYLPKCVQVKSSFSTTRGVLIIYKSILQKNTANFGMKNNAPTFTGSWPSSCPIFYCQTPPANLHLGHTTSPATPQRHCTSVTSTQSHFSAWSAFPSLLYFISLYSSRLSPNVPSFLQEKAEAKSLGCRVRQMGFKPHLCHYEQCDLRQIP